MPEKHIMNQKNESLQEEMQSQDRKEVGTSNNAIKMNYRKAATITLKFRTYNPHTSFIVWFTPDWNKPMYKCTWVMLVMKKNKKNKSTLPTSIPHIPGSSASVSTNTVSNHGYSPHQFGVDRIHLQYIPPVLHRSHGA